MDLTAQKLRYDTHQNTIDNAGYVQTFKPVIDYLIQHYSQELRGQISVLDWGSGPTPVLAELLKRVGFQPEIYDPVYCSQKPTHTFDVIVSTEVVEHFCEVRKEWNEVLKYLKPGGVFVGLTQFQPSDEELKKWWYLRDPTHFSFYSEKTFRWLALQRGLQLAICKSPLFVFQVRSSVVDY